ncbi:MAG: rhomboid family intramembrane serine protease [Isosphaeraceae bacterium]|jgi:membrane associated rhomboid family serine protease
MTLRTLARETRDYPATALFSLIWVLVFAAMVASRFTEGPPVTWRQFLLVGMNDGHRFGDLTIKELAHGEIWRLVTCTFVHYSLIHILLNILAFYLLGTMIESWYGSWQFIFIYLLTGSLGNLLSALGRQAAHYSPTTHSAGGSTVIMGLIGLCLVVGWRSRSSREGELRWHMLVSLGLTALLGFVFRDYIDNWGHAGGALVGIGLGFADRRFVRGVRRPSAWGLGVMAGLVIAGCGLAQLAADRREAPLRRQALLRAEVNAREIAYRNLRAAPMLLDQKADPRLLARGLDVIAGVLDGGTTRSDFRRLRELAAVAGTRALTEAEQIEFKKRAGALSDQLRPELNVRLRELWKERRKTDARNR